MAGSSGNSDSQKDYPTSCQLQSVLAQFIYFSFFLRYMSLEDCRRPSEFFQFHPQLENGPEYLRVDAVQAVCEEPSTVYTAVNRSTQDVKACALL